MGWKVTCVLGRSFLSYFSSFSSQSIFSVSRQLGYSGVQDSAIQLSQNETQKPHSETNLEQLPQADDGRND
jgi:hypothetical protein